MSRPRARHGPNGTQLRPDLFLRNRSIRARCIESGDGTQHMLCGARGARMATAVLVLPLTAAIGKKCIAKKQEGREKKSR